MNNLDEYMTQDIYEYLNICNKIKCKKYDIRMMEIDDKLYYGCWNNIIELVNHDIKKGEYYLSRGLWGACYRGHTEIVEMMIMNGANAVNYALWGACAGGNIKIVEMLIKKGANDWNGGLCGACFNGRIDIVEMMIKKGATKCVLCGKSIANHLKK